MIAGLQNVLPGGSERNTEQHAATAMQRPDVSEYPGLQAAIRSRIVNVKA